MILKFILWCLLLIHKGTILSKIAATLSLSAALSLIVTPMDYLMEELSKWTIDNSDYIWFVIIAIAIDHVLGTMVHLFIKKDFTFKKNIVGMVVKLSMAVAMGFLFEGVSFLTKEASIAESYLIIALRLTVFVYPAGSAAWNCAIITNGTFPPIGFFMKLKAFNTNLDLSSFKNKEKDVDNETDNQ